MNITPRFTGKVQIYGGSTELGQYIMRRLSADGIAVEDFAPVTVQDDPRGGNRLLSNADLVTYKSLDQDYQDTVRKFLADKTPGKKFGPEVYALLDQMKALRDDAPVFQVFMKSNTDYHALSEDSFQKIKTMLQQ